MTEYKPSTIHTSAYRPGPAKQDFDPVKQFEKDFDKQIAPRIIQVLTEECKKHFGFEFGGDLEEGGEHINTFYWFICNVSDLSFVSHHILINQLGNVPILIRDMLLNTKFPFTSGKMLQASVKKIKTVWENECFIGEVTLQSSDEGKPQHTP